MREEGQNSGTSPSKEANWNSSRNRMKQPWNNMLYSSPNGFYRIISDIAS